MSRAHPGAADLDVEGGRIAAERDVDAHVKPEASRQLVAHAGATGEYALWAVDVFEIVPGAAHAREPEHTETAPELPAQLGFGLRNLFALVAHDGDAPERDVGMQIERRVAESCGRVAAEAQVEVQG